MKKTVCELFAGVGGFRLGFERLKTGWQTVWFNQWEPGKKNQWAHECYVKHFGDIVDLNGDYTTNIDISEVKKKSIPDHTLIVGGFPCQDYSVAHGLSSEKGIRGKKGVLWWQIYEILKTKKPPFCLFENVDRLLKSPSKQKGRDFGIMLACLNSLGYSVEWRVVNAAQYGAAQRRRRAFIFAYHKSTEYYKRMKKYSEEDIINHNGFFAETFPIIQTSSIREQKIDKNIAEVSDNFTFAFGNAGYMHNGAVFTSKVEAIEEKPIPLKKIIQKKNIPEECFIADEKIEKWKYQKGAKKIKRKTKSGFEYLFSEGAISFPDSIELPGRTMLTSEGTLNRSTHILEDPTSKKLRILTPIETERLQGFDDNWTNSGMPNRMRYFCMGNALVVPMITRMGFTLDSIIDKEQ